MNKTNTQFSVIESIWTEETSSGSNVDFILLKDGRIVGLHQNSIVLYPSKKASQEDQGNYPAMDFPYAAADILPKKLGELIHDAIGEYTVDVIQMTTGFSVGIDSEQICLYASIDDLYSGEPESVLTSIQFNSEDKAE